MSVGALRRVITGLPDEMPISIEAWAADDVCDGEVLQVELQVAKVEERCDETPRLYLIGDAAELRCEACMSTTGGKCNAHSEPENEER
jgi:hypothetical protein